MFRRKKLNEWLHFLLYYLVATILFFSRLFCDKTEIDDFKDDDNREDAVYEKLSMVYNKNLILNHYIVVCTKDKIPLLLSKVNDQLKSA